MRAEVPAHARRRCQSLRDGGARQDKGERALRGLDQRSGLGLRVARKDAAANVLRVGVEARRRRPRLFSLGGSQFPLLGVGLRFEPLLHGPPQLPWVEARALQPGVVPEIVHARALPRTHHEDLVQQVLALRREVRGASQVGRPKLVVAPRAARPKPPVVLGGLGEGGVPREQDEEHHPRRPSVRFRAVVWGPPHHLGRHVGPGAALGAAEGVRVGHHGGEPEVGELQTELGIQEQVLRLEVAVENPLAVAELKGGEEGAEVRACEDLLERSSVHEVIEEFPPRGPLQDQHHALDGALAALPRVRYGLLRLVKTEDVRVAEAPHRSNLLD
mmetsp:Transcript_12991/g.30655  ORF Transcript_12991/g.30655 Transcript_12991/m.30655 type:complete len:330 (-) Transcript_12991:97-1086(-)